MFKKSALALVVTLSLTACNDSNNAPSTTTPPPPMPPEPTLIAFAPAGEVKADIRWTDNGVPHITADNLESIGFGSGYAYAKDNLCVLADQILKVKGERSKYLGPDKVLGSGDFTHLISDFGYKALGLNTIVEEQFDSLSDNSRALLQGYAKGYNKYLADTAPENLPVECAGQPWVTSITDKEIAAYLLSIARSTASSRSLFMQLAYFANPSDNYLPYPSVTSGTQKAVPALGEMNPKTLAIDLEKLNEGDIGSNAWAIGKEWSENGKGALLANPHFPHSGNLRFWQSHITIPGVLDAMGASLQGFPGPINIGFNKNISWTHTVTPARHFALYQLQLDPTDNTKYVVDGETKQIEKRTVSVEVAIGNGTTASYSKDFYYSHHGLMLEVPNPASPITWNDTQAFTMKDANEANLDMVDHWLAINLATNFEAFEQSFKDYDGIPFTNTIYADDAGNAYYIDDTPVLNFSTAAQEIMATNPAIIASRESFNWDIVPGNTTLFDTDGLVPFEQAPKLLRNDYVQNSNDSYWATNTASLLTNHPLSYGTTESALSMRTRMSLKMLDDSKGDDSKFNLDELESALLSNRLYLAELIMDSIVAQCEAQGDTPVLLGGTMPVSVSQACLDLAAWDRKANANSQAGYIFREIAYNFDAKLLLANAFDAQDPANTPNTLINHPQIMQLFALAVANLQTNGFPLNSTLGDMQFVEKTLADGTASTRLPWAGGTSVEGGFNVFSSVTGFDDTLLPSHSYTAATDLATGKAMPSGLTTNGYQVTSGSSWMYVLTFDDNGPVARGALLTSQSSHSESLYFQDQSALYSQDMTLRPLPFSASDIEVKTVEHISITE